MSRPLAFSGFSFMCGCVLACVLLHLGANFAVLGILAAAVLVVALAIFVISRVKSEKKAKNSYKTNTAVLSFFGLALLLCFIHGKFLIEPTYKYADGKEHSLHGTVESVNYYDTSARLKLKSADGTKFYLYVPILSVVNEGDSFSGEFTFEKSAVDVSSPISDGIYLTAEEKSISFKETGEISLLQKTREIFKKRLYCCFDSLSAKISEAVVTGDRTYLPAEISDGFKSAGAYHVLVISGMHLTLAASFAAFLFGLLPISRKKVYLLELLFVFLYMLVTGFSVSIVRAGIMLAVCTFGKMSGSRYDPITSVTFAAMLMLLANPFSVLSLSFVYSFAAVFGIEVFYPEMMGFFEKRVKKLPYYLSLAADGVLSVVCMSICANAMILPFEMLFGTCEPMRSVVAGSLLAVPSTAVVTVGLLFACVPHFLHFLILPLRSVMAAASRLCVKITEFVTLLPSVTVSMFAPIACFLTALVILLGFIFARKRKDMIAVLCAVLFVFMSAVEMNFASGSSFLIVCTGSKGFSVASVQNSTAEIVVTDSSTVSDMKDALTKVHCKNVSAVILRDGLSESVWSGLGKTGYLKANSRSYDIGGVRVSVMLEEKGDAPDCDVLVTRSLLNGEKSDSTFTIVSSGAIIKDNLNSALAGRYLLAEEDKTEIIEIKNNSLYVI